MGGSCGNLVSDPSSGAGRYMRALLDRLGTRDPLAVLAESPGTLKGLVESTDPEKLGRGEGPGRWSVIEVLAHLADIELVSGYRARMIVAHDEPEIQAFDQDAWADRLAYGQTDPSDSLAMLQTLRHANLRIFRRLTPEELRRAGQHAERGRETLDRFIRLLAGHDLVHRDQVERILSSQETR